MIGVWVYAASTCLIAASYGEGFGLPLIEAAHHGLPLLVRDIPVFREVTAGKAQFFTDSHQPEVIAEATRDWLALYRQGKHPHSDAIAHLTWVESARIALEIVLGNTPPYRTWLPDGVRRYWGADPRMHTEVGKRCGTAMCTTGKTGMLIYGPYEKLAVGNYRVIFSGNISKQTENERVDVCANQGDQIVAESSLTGLVPGYFDVIINFTIGYDMEYLEFRMYVNDQSDMSLQKIQLINRHNLNLERKNGQIREWIF